MEMKNKEYFEGEDEEKQQIHQFEGLIFAAMAGSAAIVMGMLLFRRALLVSFLQQWRFLAINLLFLTIISLTSGNKKNSKTNCRTTIKKTTNCCEYEYSNDVKNSEKSMAVEESVDGDGYGEMTKEELNRRAEAFIARFRMQLVSDQAKTAAC